MAAGIGLGIDESYMVVAGRGALRLGYFDHPLISWWMARGVADLFGTETAVLVRLPFITLFAVSTWMMAKLAPTPRAGLWAALAFNLAPVFGVTTGGWVLPDGPLTACLLAATLCLQRALPGPGWRWWLGAGVFAGLAMLSKYTAVLTLGGVVLYLIIQPAHRFWLARPQPYVAGLIALVVFCPVIIWNQQNGWASLAFQGGRAAASRLQPFGPLITLGGEALFLLPWIWAGLMLVLWRGLQSRALLAWLALPPIVLFTVISLWSRQVLFHWASPGYLMLFPLLGAWLADRPWAPRAARWTAGFVLVLALLVIGETRLGLLPGNPAAQARDWTSLRPALAARGLLTLPVAAPSWSDAGKVGIGLGPDIPLFCLNTDAREFRFSTTPPLSGDVLIVAPRRSLAQMQAAYRDTFASIEELSPVVTLEAGAIPLYLGHGLTRWP